MSFVYMRYDEIEDYLNKKSEGEGEDILKEAKEKKNVSFLEKNEEEKENQDKNQINNESDKKNRGPFMEGNVINLETGKDKTKEEENGGDQFLFS